MIKFTEVEPVKSKEAARKPGEKDAAKSAEAPTAAPPPEAVADKPATAKRKKSAAV